MLSHNRQIFEKANALLDEFSSHSDEDLALLLQDRNCVDALIGETYNNARFLNKTDVGYLVEKIRKSVAADVRAEEQARAEMIREAGEKEAERLTREAEESLERRMKRGLTRCKRRSPLSKQVRKQNFGTGRCDLRNLHKKYLATKSLSDRRSPRE